MAQDTVPFLEMFTIVSQDPALQAILKQARVLDATVDKAQRTMRIRIRFSRPVAPVYIGMIEQLLKGEYAFSGVEIVPVYPLPDKVQVVAKTSGGVKKVARLLQQAGADVQLKLYDGYRHEILNDGCKEEVAKDLLSYLENP